jgi:hypothetical protein
VVVISGYIISVISALFSMYKFRMFVLQRMRELNSNGIKPTLKRVVFLQRALANHSKRQLLPHSERADAACSLPGWSGADNDDRRTTMNQQQEAFEKRVQQQLLLQQQQHQALQEQYEKSMASMQRQIQELRSQLQHPKHDQ